MCKPYKIQIQTFSLLPIMMGCAGTGVEWCLFLHSPSPGSLGERWGGRKTARRKGYGWSGSFYRSFPSGNLAVFFFFFCNFENFSFISSCFLLMFTALGCPSSCVSGVLVSSHSAPPVPITVFILLFPSAVHSGFSSHPQSTCLTRPVKVRRILTHF